jgi:hypothetical protein
MDHLPHDGPVPDMVLRLRCSACGSKNVETIPDWRGGSWAQSYGKGF